jgi:hypothetical protein
MKGASRTAALQNCVSSGAVGIVRASESFATEGRFEQRRRQRRRLTVGQETPSLQATRWTRNRNWLGFLSVRFWIKPGHACLPHWLSRAALRAELRLSVSLVLSERQAQEVRPAQGSLRWTEI